MAVGEHIGHGELGHAGGPGGLDDPHIGDVVGGEGVKPQAQQIAVLAHQVVLQDGIGDCLPFGGLPVGVDAERGQLCPRLGAVGDQCPSVDQVDACVGKLNHGESPFKSELFSFS